MDVRLKIQQGAYKNDVPFHPRDRHWQAREYEIKEAFKADLFEEFGVTANPKREKCFEIAWSNGHASGYREVYGHFSEIVVLIQD